MQSADNRPWYKQFWPWFLIIIPLSSMVLSFNMLRFAFESEDSLVEDDYYKEGKAINISLQKVEEARRLNIAASILFSENSVALTFQNDNLVDGSALTLDFFHSTQRFKDFSLVLLKDAAGTYRASFEHATEGKWRISLHPHDDTWKIQQVVGLPQSYPVIFKP